MVDSNCATFMIGPLSPPSAAANSAAVLERSTSMPNSRCPATFAATVPTFVPTFMYRAARAEKRLSSLFIGCLCSIRGPDADTGALFFNTRVRKMGGLRPAEWGAEQI